MQLPKNINAFHYFPKNINAFAIFMHFSILHYYTGGTVWLKKISKSTRKHCNISAILENKSLGYLYWYFQYFQNAKKVLKYWVFLDFFTSIGIEY